MTGAGNDALLKKRTDALVKALYHLSSAAGEASTATNELLLSLESAGHDVSKLRDAFQGIAPAIGRVSDASAGSSGSGSVPPMPPPPAALSRPPLSSPAPLATTQSEAEPATPAKRGRKPRETKAAKDPDAPKRPLPAQLAFINEQRRHIKEERAVKGLPPLSRQESQDMLATRWSALPHDIRDKLEVEHMRAMEEYHRKQKEYLANKRGHDDDSPDAKRAKPDAVAA